MKKAKEYKTIRNFKKAVENLPAVPLVRVSAENYDILPLDFYKVFLEFDIKPAAIHPHFRGRNGGFKHFDVVGYRVSLEVGRLVEANKKMLLEIGKYL